MKGRAVRSVVKRTAELCRESGAALSCSQTALLRPVLSQLNSVHVIALLQNRLLACSQNCVKLLAPCHLRFRPYGSTWLRLDVFFETKFWYLGIFRKSVEKIQVVSKNITGISDSLRKQLCKLINRLIFSLSSS